MLKDKLSSNKRPSVLATASFPKLIARVKLTEERADAIGYLKMASKRMNKIVSWAETKYDFSRLTREYHKKLAVQLVIFLLVAYNSIFRLPV